MADDDKQIEIKKRARRRLVGAAALALLAIIVLPMVMDSEPRPLEQEIQVRIPPQTGVNSAARAIDAPMPVVEPAVSEVKDATPVPKSEASVPVAEARPDVRPAPGPAPAAKPAPAKPEAGKPLPAQAADVARPALTEAARVAAILAGQSPDEVGAPRDGGFVVQVGAYRDGGNASSLQGRLKADGLPAYTERAGDKTRVRVGPFDDRGGAESALARIRRMGLGGSVIEVK